jgi:hypothetical protein
MSNVKCSQVHALTISSIPRGFAVSLLTLLIATYEIDSNPPECVKAILATASERRDTRGRTCLSLAQLNAFGG